MLSGTGSFYYRFASAFDICHYSSALLTKWFEIQIVIMPKIYRDLILMYVLFMHTYFRKYFCIIVCKKIKMENHL